MDPERLATLRARAKECASGRARTFPIYSWGDMAELLADRDHWQAEAERLASAAGASWRQALRAESALERSTVALGDLKRLSKIAREDLGAQRDHAMRVAARALGEERGIAYPAAAAMLYGQRDAARLYPTADFSIRESLRGAAVESAAPYPGRPLDPIQAGAVLRGGLSPIAYAERELAEAAREHGEIGGPAVAKARANLLAEVTRDLALETEGEGGEP
jgi:hypothetical protein